MRHNDRRDNELRPITFQRGFSGRAPGSVLVSAGKTAVLCTASIDDGVPEWIKNPTQGWLTAEYSMLPGSTRPRKGRERTGKVDGRTSEIQRLIGRSLRAIIDLKALGPRTITLDCDVIEADGGTRTASITGAFVALVDGLANLGLLADLARRPLLESVAAVSVGIVDDVPLLDLDYREDVSAAVDMNIVMTGDDRFIEVQGTGEKRTFSPSELTALLALASQGIAELRAAQRAALGADWPWK